MAAKARSRSVSRDLTAGSSAGSSVGSFFGKGGAQSLAAAEAVCTGAIVAYDLTGAQQKKLPRPGPIVASVAFYSLLAFAAAASSTFRPAVVASGWVLALAVLVTGRRGQGLLGLVAGLARLAAKIGGGGSTSTAQGGGNP